MFKNHKCNPFQSSSNLYIRASFIFLFYTSFTVLSGYIDVSINLDSDFVTNSYGESWDSSCEQIMSPNPEPLSPSSKNNKY